MSSIWILVEEQGVFGVSLDNLSHLPKLPNAEKI